MQLDLTNEELAVALELINKGVMASLPPAWVSLIQKTTGALIASKGAETASDPSD